MRVIPPLQITNARLTSSTAPEPGIGEVAYDHGTTYGAGARVILGSPSGTATITVASPAVITWTGHGQPEGAAVILTTSGALPTGLTAGVRYYVRNPAADTFELATAPGGVPIVTTGGQSGTHTATAFVHRIFESLQASNTAHYPTLAASAEWWKDVGPTNRWAMFDAIRNSRTEQAASPLTVVITPGQRIDAVALLGVEATSAQVSMTSGGDTVYDSGLVDMNMRAAVDWYAYFFAEFETQPSLVFFDLPPVTDGVITVTLSNSGAPVKCGACVVGTQVFLGDAQISAQNDVLNFSTVERDEVGNATLTQRRNVPKTNQRLFVNYGQVNRIRRLRDSLDATPAVWSGLDDDDGSPWFEALLILGFYRKFSINVAHHTHAVIDLELEEV